MCRYAGARGGHRPGSARRAPDQFQNVLWVQYEVRRAAQHPDVPHLPGDAGGPARHQPARGRVRHPDRPRAQLHHRAHVAVRAQELLLPGPAQELPDLPVRAAPGGARVDDLHPERRDEAGRHPPRAPGGGHGQASPRRHHGGGGDQPGGFQSLRRSADGDCERAGHPHARRGGRIPAAASRHPGLSGSLRWQHGGGQLPLRRQRVGSPPRLARVRDEGRSQEHELVQECPEGPGLRDPAADQGRAGG